MLLFLFSVLLGHYIAEGSDVDMAITYPTVLNYGADTHHIDPGKLHEWLIEYRLTLMYLPLYKLEFNPFEVLWKHL